MGTTVVQTFLSYLTVNRYVSTSTQNQALNAFYEMLKHKYQQEIEFTVSEHELQFKNQALLDIMSSTHHK